MFCKKCGNEIKDSDKFCKKCGNPISLPAQKEVLIKEDSLKEDSLKEVSQIEAISKENLSKKEKKSGNALNVIIVVLVIILILILAVGGVGIYLLSINKNADNKSEDKIEKIDEDTEEASIEGSNDEEASEANSDRSSDEEASETNVEGELANSSLTKKDALLFARIINDGYDSENSSFYRESTHTLYEPEFALVDVNGDGDDDLLIFGYTGWSSASATVLFMDIDGELKENVFAGAIDSASNGKITTEETLILDAGLGQMITNSYYSFDDNGEMTDNAYHVVEVSFGEDMDRTDIISDEYERNGEKITKEEFDELISSIDSEKWDYYKMTVENLQEFGLYMEDSKTDGSSDSVTTSQESTADSKSSDAEVKNLLLNQLEIEKESIDQMTQYSTGYSTDHYALADLDGDGDDELIVKYPGVAGPGTAPIHIYTVKNGKICEVTENKMEYTDDYVLSSEHNGILWFNSVVYVCSFDNSIINAKYKLEGTKFTIVEEETWNETYPDDYWDDEADSKIEYKYVHIVGGKEQESFKYEKNNAPAAKMKIPATNIKFYEYEEIKAKLK